MKSSSIVREIIEIVLLIVLVVLPFRILVAEPYLVKGVSMSPTYETGHYLIINKFWHKFKGLERGDVVVFKSPVEDNKFYIKRAIGLPGEQVTVSNNQVTITSPNGKITVLDEPYLREDTRGSASVTLDDDEYFVMGDNRGNSYDSRAWGPLPAELIKGEPVVRLFPFNMITTLPGTHSDYLQ